MRTLAIDTSLALGGVAALDGERLVERRFAAATEHARLLAPMLARAAADLGWTPQDVELVAVVRGPGSFTGLRVGVASAKAIAWAAAARLVAVSTFEVIAWQTARSPEGRGPDGRSGSLAVALDAGRGEVFAAEAVATAASPTGWTVGTARIVAATTWLAALPPGTCVTGPALDLLSVATRPDLVFAAAAARHPTAAAAGALARLRAAAGEAHDPLTLVPDYMRPSYADEKTVRDPG